MVDPSLFRLSSFANGTAISGLYMMGMTSVWVLITLYLQDGLGRTALEAGLVGLPAAVLVAAGSNWAGGKVTAYGRRVVIWGIFGGLATIYGPVAAVFILYPLTEWLGSFRAFGELRLLIFAIIVLLVLLFLPRGLTPWVRDKIETQCPRCKQRNGAWKKLCRLCGAALQTDASQSEISRAKRLVGHQ